LFRNGLFGQMAFGFRATDIEWMCAIAEHKNQDLDRAIRRYLAFLTSVAMNAIARDPFNRLGDRAADDK
jgi:hypothetical protein